MEDVFKEANKSMSINILNNSKSIKTSSESWEIYEEFK